MSMMKPVIADSSAILAYLNFEPGADIVGKQIARIRLSTVNLAEIITVLTRTKTTGEGIESRVLKVFSDVILFDVEQACLCGVLEPITRPKGLSLGDRACIAAGLLSGCTILCAESKWTEIDWAASGYYPKIELIR
jgi:PIN domain nuclease of toxin-antitoxin system